MTILECATAGCIACRATVQLAHRVTGIQLHNSVYHGKGVQPDPLARSLVEDAAIASEIFTDDELEAACGKPVTPSRRDPCLCGSDAHENGKCFDG